MSTHIETPRPPQKPLLVRKEYGGISGEIKRPVGPVIIRAEKPFDPLGFRKEVTARLVEGDSLDQILQELQGDREDKNFSAEVLARKTEHVLGLMAADRVQTLKESLGDNFDVSAAIRDHEKQISDLELRATKKESTLIEKDELVLLEKSLNLLRILELAQVGQKKVSRMATRAKELAAPEQKVDLKKQALKMLSAEFQRIGKDLESLGTAWFWQKEKAAKIEVLKERRREILAKTRELQGVTKTAKPEIAAPPVSLKKKSVDLSFSSRVLLSEDFYKVDWSHSSGGDIFRAKMILEKEMAETSFFQVFRKKDIAHRLTLLSLADGYQKTANPWR